MSSWKFEPVIFLFLCSEPAGRSIRRGGGGVGREEDVISKGGGKWSVLFGTTQNLVLHKTSPEKLSKGDEPWVYIDSRIERARIRPGATGNNVHVRPDWQIGMHQRNDQRRTRQAEPEGHPDARQKGPGPGSLFPLIPRPSLKGRRETTGPSGGFHASIHGV